jgi:hypothetical protein
MKIDSSLTLTMRMYYTNHFEVIKYVAALIHLIVYNGGPIRTNYVVNCWDPRNKGDDEFINKPFP